MRWSLAALGVAVALLVETFFVGSPLRYVTAGGAILLCAVVVATLIPELKPPKPKPKQIVQPDGYYGYLEEGR